MNLEGFRQTIDFIYTKSNPDDLTEDPVEVGFSLHYPNYYEKSIRFYRDNLWYYENNKPVEKVMDLFGRRVQVQPGGISIYNQPDITTKGLDILEIPTDLGSRPTRVKITSIQK